MGEGEDDLEEGEDAGLGVVVQAGFELKFVLEVEEEVFPLLRFCLSLQSHDCLGPFVLLPLPVQHHCWKHPVLILRREEWKQSTVQLSTTVHG